MAVNNTWTDPSAGGALDLATGGTVTEAVWDATVSNLLHLGGTAGYIPQICQGRLTLTTGVPVPTADQLAKTILYFTPYKGNKIALYDGAAWQLLTLAEISLSLSTVGLNQTYDVFVDYNGGTPNLGIVTWANETNRATALVLQDGVLVLQNVSTSRYVGTIRGTANGQCEDSGMVRGVWNYYNRVLRLMAKIETAVSWTYNGTTPRPRNNSTANRVSFVVGVTEDAVVVRLSSEVTNGEGAAAIIGIGQDRTDANDAGAVGATGQATAITVSVLSLLTMLPVAGFHFAQALEWTSGATCTFIGAGIGLGRSGSLTAEVLG